ncbi:MULTISPECIES: ABC transporter permease subunit [unclassified Mesorhizobium]|uniref:ABC transporter permease n=1 Tax=unclassified Mesorhizobium TaxID=325217 RepID=UPI000FCB5B1E|nr:MULTISPECIES: ABC transporter permease subunit [unclassified Mesorhizobium]TIT80222.1 MAG: ABC transporter permease subunit [Mesorhizobium sp.]TGP20124.1 ABC transporter permease subunit [Mesorhizobium sp. M1D.F.Ca.ET.231.01.1.1]TGP27496.1 ABC transporter permease subunit [Mesorhizobium sp. M1D.F.Ca.ET.234.01.1.1]TGS41531.1 ABC transporter permease subunit [Mesorhizobium sp. M1D.F.Ca.ET.184.01.1.1]TGS59292.1 ABC transporter permease subunit [Mesorhizobium sp. M1D.F.Ca.ET.183.01.1.1]
MDSSIVTYAVPFLLTGAKTTLLIAAFGVGLGLPFGILLATARICQTGTVRKCADFYCAVFRGTPMLVQIFVIYYGLAQIGFIRHNAVLWWLIGDSLHAAILAVILNTGAYTAEIFRTALLSLPRGLIEAAEACGMSGWVVFHRIKFPLALRQAVPSYSTEVAVIVKESSLASTITVLEITGYAKRLMSETFAILEIFVVTAAFYLAINVICLTALHAIERRLSFERHSAR